MISYFAICGFHKWFIFNTTFAKIIKNKLYFSHRGEFYTYNTNFFVGRPGHVSLSLILIHIQKFVQDSESRKDK